MDKKKLGTTMLFVLKSFVRKKTKIRFSFKIYYFYLQAQCIVMIENMAFRIIVLCKISSILFTALVQLCKRALMISSDNYMYRQNFLRNLYSLFLSFFFFFLSQLVFPDVATIFSVSTLCIPL